MRRVFIALCALIIIALVWYLFLKPQDYQVNFKVKTTPGTVNQTVKAWHTSMGDFEPVEQESLNSFKQELAFNDSIHEYHWDVSAINDSMSHIKVNIKDVEHSLINKIQIPFSDTDFEKKSRKTLLAFNDFLNDHLKDFKVTIVGEDELFSSACACIPVKTSQIGKAKGMMRNYSFLNSILYENGVELNGPPFVEVIDWNIKTDSLSYNFCYPIIRSESLPNHPDITYKRIFDKKTLKAEYNGNYITSDRAWYALLNYAELNNIEVEKKPVEVFYSNPNLGGNELQWKADIYLPIKEANE
ncbi:GyrI-like domain-containing protein [Flagellimonas pacifica]|uniref:Effector-binding domain-containing protein n=1 Tax=Flagellimonas pacifica TaxID=1247520 RepID=A0A285MGI2_9FLAO|nr:GyrI-like domain-containing protein [Allomuricauda parva]SNY94581.1 effector-binding domain-containing protein [Allomuricauda parva]